MARSLAPYIQGIKDRGTTLMNVGEPGTAADKSQLLREINELGHEANRQLERMSSTLLLRVESLRRKSLEVDQRARRLIVASMLLVVAGAMLTAYLIAGRLLKPVRELVAGTGHVMAGNLGYRVPIVEKDEIGELAQSFNAMAQEIQEHREHLEKMVQAKTAELEQARVSLLQSEKLASIGLLASGVAHELNNPLTSILMNVNLLMEEVEDQPELHKELKRIGDDTIRCKRIIDDLRDFSRRHELDIHSSDLNEVVRNTLGLIAHELKLHGITLFEELYAQMPSIPCDPGRMQQVLMNIFVNAIQAMPRGGSLTVRTGMRESLAEIAVKDTGPGIAAEVRGKIFDPFFTTKPDGTGLGLSIAYGIMEEHGGSVAVESLTAQESRTGESGTPGTTVRLFLPVKKIGHEKRTECSGRGQEPFGKGS
ncbi:MAG: HAMP domain-containing protein [Deltaproteobacteria bacterium]|nr:HAMP domain-containing protein [Deltaproteobacteria bacterium]MBI3064138.1 HAMP domain-containing protein [Deltaproteobacteria bacterium]